MPVSKLRDGSRIVGSMIRMVRNPAIAMIAKDAGLDFIMLDMEHGAYSFETASDIAKIARSIGIGIFVRIPELSKGYVSRIMDCGADGVMLPMIQSVEAVKTFVELSRYPPIGKRGFGTPAEHTSFKRPTCDVPTFLSEQNSKTLTIAQIETKEAVKNIDEIARVSGLDVLLIGPKDLSVSLGCPGDVMATRVQDAIGEVSEAAKKHRKFFAMHGDDTLLDRWEKNGMQMVMSDLDIDILKSGFSKIVEKYR